MEKCLGGSFPGNLAFQMGILLMKRFNPLLPDSAHQQMMVGVVEMMKVTEILREAEVMASCIRWRSGLMVEAVAEPRFLREMET
jgi:hypothetical protein